MAITMIVELSCDHEGCDVAYAPAVTELTSVKATRTGSILAGWTRLDGQDYCPGHSAAAEPSIVAEIRALAGRLSDGRIAERLGMTRTQVQATRSRYGIPGCRPGRPRTAWTPDKRSTSEVA